MNSWKKIEEGFIAACLASATAILFVNVVLRYGFAANPSWVEELVRYLMIAITFIGAAVCFRRGTHISVDFIRMFLNRSANRVLNIVIHVITLIFLVLLTIYSSYLVYFTYNSGQIMPSIGLPFYLVYLVIPVGTLLSILHLVLDSSRIWKGEIENTAPTEEVRE